MEYQLLKINREKQQQQHIKENKTKKQKKKKKNKKKKKQEKKKKKKFLINWFTMNISPRKQSDIPYKLSPEETMSKPFFLGRRKIFKNVIC